MQHSEMMEKMASAKGFIAALDQSGGSTPKALAAYGVDQGSYETEDEMFERMHEMRTRIIMSPSFTGEKVIGAILFEKTMDGLIDGKPVPQVLIERGVVPFLKIDHGLLDEEEGVQLMKPIPNLEETLARAKSLGVFGTKMRSVLHKGNRFGVMEVVKQQFEVAQKVMDAGLVPIIEPEVNIKSDHRGTCDRILQDTLRDAVNALPAEARVMIKVSLPVIKGLYNPLVDASRVLRMVALSGGFSRAEACAELAKNRGMIASFSRALVEDLRYSMSDEEFDATLGAAINEIYEASVDKVSA